MKFRPISILTFLLLSLYSSASYSQSFAPTASENSLLWSIEGNGAKGTSYLFGTIHLIPAEHFILTDATRAAFQRCNRVVFEIDLEEMSDLSAMLPLLMKAFMRNGETLGNLLSKADYELVKGYFETLGMPMFMVDRVKPMFLSAMTGQSGGTSNATETKSYEIELLQMAKKAKKPVEGLETAAYQMSMFDSIPYKVQAQMLVESLKMESGDNDTMDALIDLYKAQDLFGLQKMMEGEAGIGEFADLLLNRRNENWIPVMAEKMNGDKIFFAVGAGHLAGENGVIALLREAGYKVEPIR
jgi:uncharacterized protein YbaP (TraB family)